MVGLVLVSALPANAQLQNLVDLLIPPPKQPPPPAAPPPAAPPPAPASSAPAPKAASNGKPAGAAAAPFPLAVPNIKRSPARSTALLFETLQTVVDRGLPMERAILKVVAPFPVAGPAKFSHDWGLPRYTPYPHLHQGTDIFANFGTPLVATESGKILAKGSAGAGGISVWVSGDSGTAYYYAHMQAWVKGLAVGQRVEKGSIIGFVGNSGNAIDSPPHVHFQIHPGSRGNPGGMGTPPRDPKPFLDDALRQAELQALALAGGAGAGGAITDGGKTVPVPLLILNKRVDKLLQSSSIRRPEDLLWFSMIDPTLGVLGLARQSAQGAGLPAPASAADAKREERTDAVRAAVARPRAKVMEFVNNNTPRGKAAQTAPAGVALAFSSGDAQKNSLGD